jgi:hypothetical protein
MFVLNPFIILGCRINGVKLGKDVVFTGFPKIHRNENSRMVIGDCCRFNSARNSIRSGLQRRCAIVTLKKRI